jgi:ubiquinone/menaquinone biosynthesis C-methylase UbiE
MRVVDLGCGAGSLTLAIASIVAPGEVLGYDSQPLAIDRARELAQQAPLQNVRFEVSNIETLDLPEARFDVAHFSGTLGYLRNPLAAVEARVFRAEVRWTRVHTRATEGWRLVRWSLR